MFVEEGGGFSEGLLGFHPLTGRCSLLEAGDIPRRFGSHRPHGVGRDVLDGMRREAAVSFPEMLVYVRKVFARLLCNAACPLSQRVLVARGETLLARFSGSSLGVLLPNIPIKGLGSGRGNL